MNMHRALGNILAFFKRDLAIARSYRMAFVIEILEAFLALQHSIISRSLFRLINLAALFHQGATTSPSP
jgi:hypothetical protein